MSHNLKKLFSRLQESLPSDKRVYFIYTHKNDFARFYNGLKANTELSYWGLTALKKAFPAVRFLRFQNEKASRISKIRSQDVVIGHIGPTFLAAAQQTKKLIAFNPWAGDEDRCQEAFNCSPKEVEMALYDKCISLVLLTSEFNKREYFEKPKNFWYPYFQKLQEKRRIRLVHQPIDLNLFKRIKWNYTTNDFLYIGNNAHMKCVPDSIELVKRVGRKLTLYGIGGKKMNHLDPKQVEQLPKEADFFIQPGMWEAQCVSILESAARGFIPIVSPETGYPYSHPFLLRFKDHAYNFKILKDVLNTSPKERKELADELHAQLIADTQHNNWQALTDVLVEEVQNAFSQTIEI
ncbi:MAG: hypothetical protein S4CHLAM123_02660 [Chlamydiales bacterium]|nr:hypothetical protein [Chlamydiales bacterium]